MRPGPSSELLAGSAGWAPAAASWLDGKLLAPAIPVWSGKLSAARSQQVPEKVDLVVPEWQDGTWWVPDSESHPLAKYGQVIDLAIDVTSSVDQSVTRTKLGRFRIFDWEHDEIACQVRVTAYGILYRVAEDGFTVPEVPRTGGSLASEFRRLMSPGIPVAIDPALIDRPCPQSLQYPDDRLDALSGIAEAWPARMDADMLGQVVLRPPLPETPTPILTLSDGEGGTVVSAPRGDTRAGVANVFVGTSSATDAAAQDPVRAEARVMTGPLAARDDGTGYGRVVRRWSSPLATTREQVQASVSTMADTAARQSRVRSVTHAPDPRIELDDPVAVVRRGVRETGYVIAYELPLTVGDGAMRTDVGVVL